MTDDVTALRVRVTSVRRWIRRPTRGNHAWLGQDERGKHTAQRALRATPEDAGKGVSTGGWGEETGTGVVPH